MCLSDWSCFIAVLFVDYGEGEWEQHLEMCFKITEEICSQERGAAPLYNLIYKRF